MVDSSPDSADTQVRETLTAAGTGCDIPDAMNGLPDSVVVGILSIAGDAIICIDQTQRITFFNEGAVQIFGYSANEVLGQPVHILLPKRFQDAHHRHIDGFEHARVSARRMGERSIIVGRRQSGEEFPAEAAITRIASPDGPVFSVVLRDISERVRVEQVNKRLLADMQEAVRARDELLGVVSHDLRNPVNAVKMLAAAILRADGDSAQEALPPEVADHAATMLQAANQMDALIQDLLDVTRLESGRLRLVSHPLSVEETVTAAIETMAPIAEDKALELVAETAPGLPDVLADPDRVAQLLSNLIGNAIKFTPSGGRVVVESAVDGDHVAFEVRDTGIGIAEDELPLVFDRFWQSKRTNRSGAGLGLAIVRGIVRAHGGRIWVESKVGVGTTVRFTLPIA